MDTRRLKRRAKTRDLLAPLPEPRQMGPVKGKDVDTSNGFGPWIVTADEIGDAYNLRMTPRVNGEVWGGGNSGAIYHKFEDIIAFVSQSETLHALSALRGREGR